MSARLVQAAKGKGSSDNITVVVVFLRDPSLIARRPLPTTPPKSVESPIGPTMEEQQQELSTLAEKWAWTSSAGFEPIHDLPWESAAGIASAEQDLLMAVGDDELKASNLDAPSDCQWQCKDAFLASLSQQQNGCDVRDAAPQAVRENKLLNIFTCLVRLANQSVSHVLWGDAIPWLVTAPLVVD